MRAIRLRTVVVSLLLTFAVSASAAPSDRGSINPLSKLGRAIIRILEDAAIKIGLPPG